MTQGSKFASQSNLIEFSVRVQENKRCSGSKYFCSIDVIFFARLKIGLDPNARWVLSCRAIIYASLIVLVLLAPSVDRRNLSYKKPSVFEPTITEIDGKYQSH